VHQKIGTVDSATHMRENREVTENLATTATEYNKNLALIFLLSVSVYGEDNFSVSVSEVSECHPSSDYAVSKLDAEILFNTVKTVYWYNLAMRMTLPVQLKN
jgi:nucleoside-diphosphate-sugar epimerase